MAISLEPQLYTQFKGIREYNGVNAGGAISALSATNVVLFKTDVGSGTGIRSVESNVLYKSLPTGYKGIEHFKSTQDGVDYIFIYGENATNEVGKLFYVNTLGNVVAVQIDGSDIEFDITGKCNGLTMQYGQYDMFVFTNGDDAYTVSFAQTTPVRQIEATDNQDRDIKWLSMTEWNGFLVVASEYGVHASHKNDVYTWDDVVTTSNYSVASWYVDYSKRVTAVASFATGLFIFTADDISHLNTTPNDATTSLLSSVAMNGCFSYQSLIAHGTYLFFYDDKQKNIFYIQQTDTGLTQPAGPIAKEVQSYFDGTIEKFKMYSCIYGDKNEIWAIINDKVLIYDYFNQEFVERKLTTGTTTQTVLPIVSICMYRNRVYSLNASGELKKEGQNATGAPHVYAEYKTSIINMGSFTNLKKEKTPILLVLNENLTNDFYVEIIANYKEKNPKHVTVRIANQGIWASDSAEQTIDNTWGTATWGAENAYKKRVVEISTPQTWYTLQLRIYTTSDEQGFSIESMEIKRLKAKTKTKGR